MGADFDWLTVPNKKTFIKIYKYKGQMKQKTVTQKIETKYDILEEFKNYQNCAAYESGHNYSGRLNMCPGLDFHFHTIFENKEKAYDYIANNAKKWENAICVKLKDDSFLIGGLCSC